MPVTKVGIVFYADDPHKRVFRVVYPTNDDSEFDQPPTDGNVAIICDAKGAPYSWTSFGVDAARTAVMQKVAATDTTPRLRGTPFTPASEPVVYYVNLGLVAAMQPSADKTTTPTPLDQLTTFVAAAPSWSNAVDLGSGVASALVAGIISPAWIVVIGGGNPGIGTQQKSTTIGGQAVAVWVV